MDKSLLPIIAVMGALVGIVLFQIAQSILEDQSSYSLYNRERSLRSFIPPPYGVTVDLPLSPEYGNAVPLVVMGKGESITIPVKISGSESLNLRMPVTLVAEYMGKADSITGIEALMIRPTGIHITFNPSILTVTKGSVANVTLTLDVSKIAETGTYVFGLSGKSEKYDIGTTIYVRVVQERVVIYDENANMKFANVNDIEPNSAYYFLYPITQNVNDVNERWILIRLPASMGGDWNDERAFRAYHVMDIRLGCLIKYFPETFHLGEPCHGSSYDVLNGAAVVGPAIDYNFPNNALPKLDLAIDSSGFLYVKPPKFTVDANGVIGFGRIPVVKSVQLGSSEIPVSKPDLPTIPDRLHIFKVKDDLQKHVVAEAPLKFSPLKVIDRVLLLADFGIKHELSDLQLVIIDNINIEYPDNMNTNSYLVPYYKISGRLIMPNEEIPFERTLKAVEYKIPTNLEVEVYPKEVYENFENLAISGFLKGYDNQPVRSSVIMIRFDESYLGTDIETNSRGCFYYNDWNKNFVKNVFDKMKENDVLSMQSMIETVAWGNEDHNAASVSQTIQLFRIVPPSMPQVVQLYSIEIGGNEHDQYAISIEKSEALEFELVINDIFEKHEPVMLKLKNVPCDLDMEIIPSALDFRYDSDAKAILRVASHADRSANYRVAVVATNERGDLLAQEWITVRVLP
ncbi:MAG: hypothetical protein QW769_09910 [Nitrososphaerales archaeon]